MIRRVMVARIIETKMHVHEYVSNIRVIFLMGGRAFGGLDTQTAPSSSTGIVYSIKEALSAL